MPTNLYFYKSNQPKFWIEYFKKIKYQSNNLEPINLCIKYCKDIILFPENDKILNSDNDNNDDDDDDDDSWVDIKKNL
jgi:hypothetical protein